ncbi:10844_t:CDS:1, partial [Dentiscutata heterogama]
DDWRSIGLSRTTQTALVGTTVIAYLFKRDYGLFDDSHSLEFLKQKWPTGTTAMKQFSRI